METCKLKRMLILNTLKERIVKAEIVNKQGTLPNICLNLQLFHGEVSL